MKQIIRTDIKRVLSVFLTALMLLTVWVFVAPEKAGAVTSSGSYTYRVYVNVTNDYTGTDAYYQVKGKPNNGTGTEAQIVKTSISAGSGSIFDKKKSDYFPSSSGATSTSFPSYFYVYTYKNSGPENTGKTDGAFSAELQLYLNGSWQTVASGSSGTQSGHTPITAGGSTAASYYPKASGSVYFSSNPGDKDIPKTTTSPTNGEITNGTSTFSDHFRTYIKDQYGVRISSSATGYSRTISSIKVGDTTTNFPGVTIAADGTATDYDKWKTTVTSDAQYASGSEYQRTVKLTVSYTFNNATVTGTKTFVLTDPQYTFTMDGNGGEAYISKSAYNTWKNNNYVVDDTHPDPTFTKKYYYYTFGTTPYGFRAGYEFKDMYLTAQTNYSYAVKNDWTPTGTKLTSTTKIESDKTYYAAWWAKNVTVTYLNNDGSVLKTATNVGKYDKKAGDITAAAAPANPTYVRAPGVTGTFDYVFDHWEVASAKQYKLKSDGTQEQVDYSDIVGQNYNTAVLKGDTVFVAVYRINSMNTYSITYKNGTQSGTVDTYHYKDEGKTGSYATATLPAADAENNKYTYEFLGWAEQVNSNDTVYYQDWNADLGAYVPQDNAQTPLTDTKVYHNATWVAVYGRKYIDYKVTFNFVGVTTDETGATTYNAGKQEIVTKHYDETIQIPEALSYTGGKLSGTAPAGVSYSNSTGYTYNFNAWNPALSGTEVAVADLSANGWTASNANLKTRTFTATYSSVAAVYTIEFKDYDGTVLNPANNTFSHGSSVSTARNIAEASVTRTWRDDDNEYTFTGWAPTYASTATDNVTYTAQYTSVPLYTVTYADESGELGTWKGTTAENIPLAPTNDDDEALFATPTKSDDAYATGYTFSGWATTEYDAKNPVTPQITETRNMRVPEGGTTVYAQFTRTPIIYDINFIYGNPVDGVMPSHVQHLEYGEEVTEPSEEDVARDHDDVYTYTFRGWDSTVSETCKSNATYTALYRKGYVYYTVMWYQPDLTSEQQTMTVGDETWVYYAPSTEKVRDDETYIYNNLISAPYQEPNAPASADPNYEYVLAGWLYKGTTDLLTRADRVTTSNHMSTTDLPDNRAGKIELVPVFVLKPNVKTVTFLDEDGSLLGTQKVAYGTLLKDVNVGTLPAKSATETDHYTLDGWLLKTGDDTFAEETLDADNYAIEVNITVKAKFSAKPHKYELIATTTAPTFFEEGEGELLCAACKKEGTVVLPKLTDGVAPTGRVMVKSNKWLTIADQQDAVLTAGQSVFIVNTADTAAATTYYLNKTTKEIVNELPAGAEEDAFQTLTYNNGGVGSQVGDIYLYATKTAVTPADVAADDWYRCFNYEEYHEQNHDATEANFSATVGDIASEIAVEDGETFIIYVKIVDRGGASDPTYISTAPLTYDGTPPVITITSTDGKDTVKHCVDATVEVDEGSWFFITKNGEELNLVSRTLTEAGEYTVIAYDEAGNVTRKVVEIIGSHSPKTIVTAATCTEGGEQYDVCRTCGQTISEVTQTDPLGHKLKYRVKQPTCLEDGSVTVTCRRCGEAINDLVDGYTAENGVYTGQVLAQLADPDTENGTYERLITNGEHTWGDWEVKTAATCSAVGEKVRYCTKCGEEDSAELQIDENAHRWSASIYTTPATCTEPGETYRVCRYNDAHKQHVADIEPTGHIAADEWVETLAPTCTEPGTEVQYCKYHPTVVVNTRAKDPLGHELVIDHVVDPTATEGGYTVYKCTRCDYTETGNFVDPLARYTVTFIVGDQSEDIERAQGETITSSMLTISTDKANDDVYKYTFDGWREAEKNADDEWVATDTTVKMPITVSEDMTVIAVYKKTEINYRVEFLYDTGESYKVKGYSHWNDVITVEDPTKDASATETFTFAGWKKAVKNADDVWVPTGDIVEEIVCKGDETYIAVFDGTPITYTVIWASKSEGSDYTALLTLVVNGGSDVSAQAPALPEATKAPDQNGHWTVTGWDQTPNNVTDNMIIRPVQVQQAHSYNQENTPADCTNPAKTTYTCSACDYSYSIASGKALGHSWTVTTRVNPTATSDGYEDRVCSRCGETDHVILTRNDMINLTITVKDNEGKPVSGVNVRVYDGSTLVSSGVTDGNGKAVVQVPEAKTYRIEIDGNGINGASGSITVNDRGQITGGGVPTVTRTGGGSHGCDCTCHKSGFWPIIFRFFHKIIKMITGEFRCCPDANY